MPYDELLALLKRARSVLDCHMFDPDEVLRDDIAEVCMAIDDALPQTPAAAPGRAEPFRGIYAVRGITR